MASHDAAWKRLFSFPDMPRDLLAGFVPREWVEKLDLRTLEPWPGDLVSDGLRKRHADRVWRVRRRDRQGFVLVTVEFQSRVDRTMAVRVLDYSTLLYQELLRNKELRRVVRAESDNKDRKGRPRRVKPEPLPPVLPIVLHHGTKRWWAREDVAGLCAPTGEDLAPYQPAQRYFLLDMAAYTGPLNEGKTMPNEVMRERVARWANRQLAEWAAPRMERSRVEGRTEVMCRLAARKFDPETADRLAGYLAKIPDPERLGEVGEWLLECDSGEELLARVARLCETVAAEDRASQA